MLVIARAQCMNKSLRFSAIQERVIPFTIRQISSKCKSNIACSAHPSPLISVSVQEFTLILLFVFRLFGLFFHFPARTKSAQNMLLLATTCYSALQQPHFIFRKLHLCQTSFNTIKRTHTPNIFMKIARHLYHENEKIQRILGVFVSFS